MLKFYLFPSIFIRFCLLIAVLATMSTTLSRFRKMEVSKTTSSLFEKKKLKKRDFQKYA